MIVSQVSVSEWCGIAATMNPVGRGYGGRRALPAALESILRPVAMTTPRGDELATHLLAARAVPGSEALAGDLARVFSLARLVVAMTTPGGDELATHLLVARALPGSQVLAGDLARVISLARSVVAMTTHLLAARAVLAGDFARVFSLARSVVAMTTNSTC